MATQSSPATGKSADDVMAWLSPEAMAALLKAREVYTNVAQYSGPTAAGDGVLLIASVAGTATLTFAGGGTVVVPVPVGALTLPFACTNAVQTTGTLTAYKLTL